MLISWFIFKSISHFKGRFETVRRMFLASGTKRGRSQRFWECSVMAETVIYRNHLKDKANKFAG